MKEERIDKMLRDLATESRREIPEDVARRSKARLRSEIGKLDRAQLQRKGLLRNLGPVAILPLICGLVLFGFVTSMMVINWWGDPSSLTGHSSLTRDQEIREAQEQLSFDIVLPSYIPKDMELTFVRTEGASMLEIMFRDNDLNLLSIQQSTTPKEIVNVQDQYEDNGYTIYKTANAEGTIVWAIEKELSSHYIYLISTVELEELYRVADSMFPSDTLTEQQAPGPPQQLRLILAIAGGLLIIAGGVLIGFKLRQNHRKGRWRMKNTIGIVFAVLGLGIVLGVLRGPWHQEPDIIVWYDFMKFNDIYYHADRANLQNELTFNDLGPEFAQVKFRVEGNIQDVRYRAQNGDAAFIDEGTPVYTIDGYSPEFRLAVFIDGRVKIYEADRNPQATKGQDFFDIDQKVVEISINRQRQVTHRQLVLITDPELVERMVTMVLQAEVELDKVPLDNSHSIVFHLLDGTVVNRRYCVETGYLSPGLSLPEEFVNIVLDALNE